MIGRVRVIVYYTTGDREIVLDAYERVNKELAGTAGLLGAELLESTLDSGSFAVLSEWTDLPSFQAWEEGTRHKNQTSQLRPYEDATRGRPYGIYQVVGEL
ncbi:antibiotic biosynthesis monooxygenase family protein [Fodinicola acaciae]|uniref:antibiotic biosynthesis monooxygenase family protein n=1 Tax=Fodinicola acaciae TaxID=2681555 RepID=UPI001652B62B|nr:antibiotic biosynthesis monooxygenase family protein [Fodinicola acaciae]